MPRRGRRKRGRPATGHDRVVSIRLPEKLLRDIDAWAAVYRDEYRGMDRSAAIRCLILLGLRRFAYRAVDPKDKTEYLGANRPLLKFFSFGRVSKWLEAGTGKLAKRKPPIEHSASRQGRLPTQAECNAVFERAQARSKSPAAARGPTI